MDQSRKAGDAIEASASGFALTPNPAARIAELEPQVIKRDEIKKRLSDRERESYQNEAALGASRDQLKKIEADRVEVGRLEPLVVEQEGRRAGEPTCKS